MVYFAAQTYFRLRPKRYFYKKREFSVLFLPFDIEAPLAGIQNCFSEGQLLRDHWLDHHL